MACDNSSRHLRACIFLTQPPQQDCMKYACTISAHLCIVFSKVPVPCIVRVLQRRYWLCLTHCYDPDLQVLQAVMLQPVHSAFAGQILRSCWQKQAARVAHLSCLTPFLRCCGHTVQHRPQCSAHGRLNSSHVSPWETFVRGAATELVGVDSATL